MIISHLSGSSKIGKLLIANRPPIQHYRIVQELVFSPTLQISGGILNAVRIMDGRELAALISILQTLVYVLRPMGRGSKRHLRR